MKTCRIIFARHTGNNIARVEPSSFVAEKLEPLAETALKEGRKLNVIHNYIYTIKADLREVNEFINTPSMARKWKSADKEWKLAMKRMFNSANRGEETEYFNFSTCPEFELILKINQIRRGTIINHLNFYPIDASYEYTLGKSEYMSIANYAREHDVDGVVNAIMNSDNAFAASNLLRDYELIKQIRLINEDVVVFRNLTHTYLLNLENSDTAIVHVGRVMGFDEILRATNVSLEGYVEPAEITFHEQAINELCLGNLDKERHSTLAYNEFLLSAKLLQVLNEGDYERVNEEAIKIAYSKMKDECVRTMDGRA